MARPLAGVRIAIVGGGIIGLAAARASVHAGADVTLFERDRVGQGATLAASGLVTLGLRGRSSLRQLKRAGYRAMERWIPELKGRLPEVAGERRSAIRLFETLPPTRDKLLAAWLEAGHDARFLDPAEAAAPIPGLDPASFSIALHLDQEIVVDPPALIQALRDDFVSGGGVLHEEVGPLSIVPSRANDVAIIDSGGRSVAEDADRILVASGWQSVAALGSLPDPSLAVAPTGGIGLDLHAEPAEWTVHFGDKGRTHWLKRGVDHVYLGSTVRGEGSTEPTDDAERSALLAVARAHFPSLDESAVFRVRDGLRPKAQRRGGPFLGAYPGRPRLWIATGHYRLGVATAAATAEQLVRAWSGGEPTDPGFAVLRGLE